MQLTFRFSFSLVMYPISLPVYSVYFSKEQPEDKERKDIGDNTRVDRAAIAQSV